MVCTAGEDFNRMLYNPYFDFLTLHVYPSNWQVPKPGTWVNENYIGAQRCTEFVQNEIISCRVST